MKKAQVKMGFRGLSIPAKIQKARQIVQSLTGNASFMAPNPPLATITPAINTLETAYQQALDGGKSLKAIMSDREDELDDLISNLAAYVQNISNGNAELMLSSGFEIRATAGEIGDLARPQNLRAITSGYAGQADITWKPVHGALTYVANVSTDGSNGWQHCGITTRSEISITGLPSTTHQWIRISAIGAAGQGPWSDPVKVLIG